MAENTRAIFSMNLRGTNVTNSALTEDLKSVAIDAETLLATLPESIKKLDFKTQAAVKLRLTNIDAAIELIDLATDWHKNYAVEHCQISTSDLDDFEEAFFGIYELSGKIKHLRFSLNHRLSNLVD